MWRRRRRASLGRVAPAEIAALDLPIAGLLNNAGIMPALPFKTAQGWDGTFATSHLGPFALTEALIPHLPDGANVVFVCSAVEDPERKTAVASGFHGARYISAEASARGEWAPGGSSLPGGDAYATAKQGNLATVLAFARETPRLRFNAVEPGFNPGSDLGRDANPALRLLGKYVLSPIAPLIKHWSNPKTAARMITKVLTGDALRTGGAARGLPRRAGESRPRPPRQHRATRRGEQHRLPARAGRAVQQ